MFYVARYHLIVKYDWILKGSEDKSCNDQCCYCFLLFLFLFSLSLLQCTFLDFSPGTAHEYLSCSRQNFLLNSCTHARFSSCDCTHSSFNKWNRSKSQWKSTWMLTTARAKGNMMFTGLIPRERSCRLSKLTGEKTWSLSKCFLG